MGNIKRAGLFCQRLGRAAKVLAIATILNTLYGEGVEAASIEAVDIVTWPVSEIKPQTPAEHDFWFTVGRNLAGNQ
jgi:hypothetical protein